MIYLFLLLLSVLLVILICRQRKFNRRTSGIIKSLKRQYRRSIRQETELLKAQTQLDILQEKEKAERIKAVSALQKEQERQARQLKAHEKRLRNVEYKANAAQLDLEYIKPRLRDLDRTRQSLTQSIQFCELSGTNPEKYIKQLDRVKRETLILQKRQLKAEHCIDEFSITA